MFCSVVIAALTHDFANAHLLHYIRLSKLTNMRQRTVGMFVMIVSLINHMWKVKGHTQLSRGQSWPLQVTFHFEALDSH